ncbi:D-alanine--D-alanine ligase [Streptomyces sp. Tue 6075]|uniref:D-alanine--D-alanine ligase family protein n=1 Tax=Streptomyces sp. Tue 6075 TaxID=1661694 RepID=UPI00094A19F9|nr:D-alanine--D-alanine ligase [Streptomyces sp. Tue 6075]APS19303.1 D-alanine--D-alanine ligase [Streptomyces sp. Tue 6075]
MVSDLSKSQLVGVLYGGDSPERAGSLASGKTAADALVSEGFNTLLIDTAEPQAIESIQRIDVALIALHGPGGEDGKIQGLLEMLGVPYTGSGVLASAVGMHKPTFKRLISSHGLDTPKWITLDPSLTSDEMSKVVESHVGWPVFIKPSAGGGSLGAGIGRSPSDFAHMLADLNRQDYLEYLVEEYVPGRPCSVGVIETSGRPEALPVHDVETDRDFYDYAAKHDPSKRIENCPSILPKDVTEKLQEEAVRVHMLTGAHGVSRVDFIVDDNGRSVILEINTVPGLSDMGNLATMAKAAGMPYPALVTAVLKTAFTRSGHGW